MAPKVSGWPAFQLRKTLDFCYHESVTHAGISSYGRVKYVGFWKGLPCVG
jgi:hypothetical protein